MSESERKQRIDYIKNRKRWIMIISAVLCGLLVFACAFGVLYYSLNKSYYIDYVEKGTVDYTASLKENDFYEGAIADENQAYVALLIDNIIADFDYNFAMAANDVEFEYKYSIDAILSIIDKTSGAVIFGTTDSIVPQKSVTTKGDSISVDETVTIDFEKYNSLANKFVTSYNLSGTESTLKVKLSVDFVGVCDQFNSDSAHSYDITLNVPLTEKTVVMNTSSANLRDSGQILACGNATLKNVFFVLFIVFASLAVLSAAALVVFSRLTINTDITYDIRIKKILRNYKSYIQKINNTFNEEGYQVLVIDSFDELLEIRDTLQLPILMNENIDRTSTKFIIPTSSNILYSFEIRVDNYDEIYGTPDDTEDIDVIVVDGKINEEEIIDALAQPDISLADIDFVDEKDEETENGTEVVGVVWPERSKKNKIYRYDPNGEQLNDGDIVLVPSRDEAQGKDVIRKAAVAHGNHKVDPTTIHHPLKKVIAIIKRKTQEAITPSIDEK